MRSKGQGKGGGEWSRLGQRELTVEEVVRVPTSNPAFSSNIPLRSISPWSSIIAQVGGEAPSPGWIGINMIRY